MMTQVKVTIIIAVYNGAEYLRRIFDSCIYQSLPQTEVIAVNDCSPNARDAEIMREYERLYPGKFRALFHDVNKCQGGAYNTGIKAANGEYLLCVDQDDYLELTMCEDMYVSAKTENADICVCKYRIMDNGRISLTGSGFHLTNNAFDISDYSSFKWNKLVKTDFLISNKLFYIEDVTSDDSITALWDLCANKVCICNKVLYNWVRRPGSLTISKSAKYCLSIPKLFIGISRLHAYQSLPPSKKNLFAYFAAFKLLRAILLAYFFQIQIFGDVCALTEQAINALTVNLSDKLFTKTLSAKYTAYVLEYVMDNYVNIDFDKNFKAFFSTAIRTCISSFLLDRGFSANSINICIWGAGVRGKKLAAYLNKAGLCFFVTDANTALHGKKVLNTKVQPWQEIKTEVNFVIVATKNIYGEVKTIINDSNILIEDWGADITGIA